MQAYHKVGNSSTMAMTYLQSVVQGARKSRKLRQAARDLLNSNDRTRSAARELLMADPTAADPILTELVFRNRARLSIEAASLLFELDEIRGTYALMALCADDYMVRWYEQALVTALEIVPDEKRHQTLLDALDRIAQIPRAPDWAFALATNTICSLRVKPFTIHDDIWLRVLQVPSDDAAEWLLWRGLISNQPHFPAPPIHNDMLMGNGPLALRLTAVDTLLFMSGKRILNILHRAIESKDINAQAAVLYGLARLHRPESASLLHCILSSSRHPLQRDALSVARALGADVTDILTLVRPVQVQPDDNGLLLRSPLWNEQHPDEATHKNCHLQATKEVLLTTSYKLCALDLDDTVLNSNHEVSEVTRQTVEIAMQRGVIVVIASGRMFETTLPTARTLGITSPIICYNGAMVRDPITRKIIDEACVPSEVAAEVMEYARQNGMQLNFYLHDHIYSAARNQWMELYQTRTGAPYEVIDDFYDRLKGECPTKLIIVDEPETITRLLPEMKSRFDGRIAVIRSNAEYLEFLPINANKGLALANLAKALAIAQEETVAIGDSWNDIPMLQWAGHSVAVANCKPEVRLIVDEITASCDEDGVAKALARLFNLY